MDQKMKTAKIEKMRDGSV